MNEFAIYNAKLIEVKDNLNQLNEIEIDIDSIEKTIKEIEKTTSQEIDANCQKFDNPAFLEEAKANIYRDSTQKLEKINKSITKKYQEFYIIYQNLLDLKEKQVDDNNISQIAKETIAFLKKILSLQFGDYNTNFIEKVYKFTYKIIKLELIYTNKSELLEYAKTDEVHISYLVKCIKEELEDLSEETRKQIQSKIIEVNKNGFDDIFYLDRELLFFIIANNKNKYHEILEKSIEQKCEEYEQTQIKLKNAEELTISQIKEIKHTKKSRNRLYGKMIARKALFFLNLGMLGIGIFASIKLADKVPPIKEYKTTKTYYDSSQPENREESITYQEQTDNELEITEYSPWEKPGYFRGEYKRNVYKYTIQNLEYRENVEDYLTEDLRENIVLAESTVEKSVEPQTEEYTENKYVISQTYQNKEVYNEIEDTSTKSVRLALATVIIILGELIISLTYLSRRENIRGKSKEIKKQLKEQKQLLLETKTRISSLTDYLSTIKKRTREQYEALPNFLQEEESIQKRVHKINNSDEEI